MWFLCQRRDAKPRDEWTVDRNTHLKWMKVQHEAGHIVMSGPAPGHGMSMYLMRAASLEAAEQIAAADPFTAAGQCTFQIIPWEIHQIMGVGPFSNAGIAAATAE